MLGEPGQTAYDLHFRALGFPVRVTPLFWVVVIFLGWDLVIGLNRALPDGPHRAMIFVLWIAAVFGSILIHELGHAVAMRHFGLDAAIVLYHFGGLAIPRSGRGYMASAAARPAGQMMISIAGPAAQLAAAGLVLAVVVASGHEALLLRAFGDFWPMPTADPLPSVSLDMAVTFFIVPSVFWALINLLPVYPLDGGQIAREALMKFGARQGIERSLMLSVGTGATVCFLAFTRQNLFLAMLFGFLAYSSYMTLKAYRGQGGGRPW